MNYLKQDDRVDEAIVLIDPDFLFLNRFELPKDAHPVLSAVYLLFSEQKNWNSFQVYLHFEQKEELECACFALLS